MTAVVVSPNLLVIHSTPVAKLKPAATIPVFHPACHMITSSRLLNSLVTPGAPDAVGIDPLHVLLRALTRLQFGLILCASVTRVPRAAMVDARLFSTMITGDEVSRVDIIHQLARATSRATAPPVVRRKSVSENQRCGVMNQCQRMMCRSSMLS